MFYCHFVLVQMFEKKIPFHFLNYISMNIVYFEQFLVVYYTAISSTFVVIIIYVVPGLLDIDKCSVDFGCWYLIVLPYLT